MLVVRYRKAAVLARNNQWERSWSSFEWPIDEILLRSCKHQDRILLCRDSNGGSRMPEESTTTDVLSEVLSKIFYGAVSNTTCFKL
jgi:hypothetical protein